VLEAALVGAAVVAGMTGSWSPCGFSVVETIGAAERRVSLAGSCAAFALGAVAGGIVTFGGLAAVGAAAGTGALGAGAAVAGALALAAGVAEVRGVRIVPQIRRQVPEPWRRRLPLPLAAGAYGVLLGIGFATFVLTFAVWALAAIAFLLGDVRLGLLVGVAFGAGRALPVVALAPLAGRRLGRDVTGVLAERAGLLRGARLVDGVALAACAAILLGGSEAAAATVVARGAVDPAVAGAALAWDGRGGAFVRSDRGVRDVAGAHHVGVVTTPLPGSDPALGGSLLAWREGDRVRVVRFPDFAPVVDLVLPGVDALAVSPGWLAYRLRRRAGDRIAARRLSAPGRERTIAAAGPRSSLGRPSLSGALLVYDATLPGESRIVAVRLDSGRQEAVRRTRADQLTSPTVHGSRLLYVRQTSTAQLLQLGPLAPGAGDRTLYRARSTNTRDSGYEPGHSRVTRTPPAHVPATSLLWTTALSERHAYVTLLSLRGGIQGSRIVRVRR
jgi:hypothetical protein